MSDCRQSSQSGGKGRLSTIAASQQCDSHNLLESKEFLSKSGKIMRIQNKQESLRASSASPSALAEPNMSRLILRLRLLRPAAALRTVTSTTLRPQSAIVNVPRTLTGRTTAASARTTTLSLSRMRRLESRHASALLGLSLLLVRTGKCWKGRRPRLR